MLLESATSARQRSPELHRRLRWAVAFVVAAFAVLIGRLWQLQIVRGDRYYEATLDNLVDQRRLPAVRGKIVDRAGRALADNRPAFNLYVVPARFGENERARLIDLLDASPDEIARIDERLAGAREASPRSAVLLLEDQSRDRAALVAQARAELGGIEVHDEPYRRYPNGALAAHLIGYLSHPTSKELAGCAASGCAASDFVGRYGVERQWESALRGTPGLERYITNATGERIDDAEAAHLIDGPRVVPPITGNDVVLTLDLSLQETAARAIARHSAAAAVLVEVETGRLLAVVSNPGFDPNVMTGRLTRAEDERLRSDPRRPYIDKTLQQTYPPGSIFKFVTGGAALEDRLSSPDESMTCTGRYERGRTAFRCAHVHGKVDFYGALQHSCNIYFWKLSERVGLERMAAVALDFGFGAPTGLGINGDRAGRMPTKEWYERRGRFQIGYTHNAATGQGDVEVSVMQIALAYAALANGGRLFAPQIVREVRSAAGAVTESFAPVLRRRVGFGERTLAILREGMVRVVNDTGGTATGARSEIIGYAGKTGTAQVGNWITKDKGLAVAGWNPRREHAWFAGWAPARAPEVAIAVLVEHGGAGGKVAAPVAREILEAWAIAAGRAVAPPIVEEPAP
jgi:penicillin-binding protein 2